MRTSTPTCSTEPRCSVVASHGTHPLPDGNKRAAWAALVLFVDLDGGVWTPDPPDVDQAEEAMLAVAAGDVDETWFADWLRERVRFDIR